VFERSIKVLDVDFEGKTLSTRQVLDEKFLREETENFDTKLYSMAPMKVEASRFGAAMLMA
jgi:hypothetical protein